MSGMEESVTIVLPSSNCSSECKPITGSEESHCSVCHLSFYTLRAFDAHQYDPDVPEDEDNDCWIPEDLGMVLEKGMYAFPEEHDKRRFNEQRAEKARAGRGN